MSTIEDLYLEANPEQKLKESRNPVIGESMELASEMLTWGDWSGADLDFINRAKIGNLADDEAESLRDMYDQRQRERRLRR